jgi:uncharacterized delta-60 repeat protein
MQHRICFARALTALVCIVLALSGVQPAHSRQPRDAAGSTNVAAAATPPAAMRTARAWVPDLDYGQNGVAGASIGTAYDTREPLIVGEQTSGKLIIRSVSADGNPPALRRLNADGSLDSSFAVDGTLTPNADSILDTIVAADDRIYLLNYSKQNSVSKLFVERRLPHGLLEASFDLSSDYGSVAQMAEMLAWRLGLMPDGGWVIVTRGSLSVSDQCGWFSGVSFMLKRFAATGENDQDYYAGDTSCLTKLFYAGVTSSGAVVLYLESGLGMQFWRVGADGRRDETYGINGIAAAPAICNFVNYSPCIVSVTSGGESVLVTRWAQAFFVIAVDGTLVNGQWLPPGSVLQQSYYDLDARLVSGGRILILSSAGDTMAIARVLPDGKLDASYGTSGAVRLDATYPSVSGSGLLVDSTGRAVIAGRVGKGPSAGGIVPCIPVLFRLTQNGSADLTFSQGGRAQLKAEVPAVAYASGLHLQSTGRMIVAWTIYIEYGEPAAGMARFHSSGELDQSFGLGGTRVITDAQFSGPVMPRLNDAFALSILTDSGYVLRGFTANGGIDSQFGVNGAVAVAVSPTTTGTVAINGALQGPGNTTILYGFVNRSREPSWFTQPLSDVVWVTRHMADGALDPAFAEGGIWAKPVQRLGSMCAAVQPDGRVLLRYIGHSSKQSTESHLMRLTQNGTVDGSLDVTAALPYWETVHTMHLFAMPDGRIVNAEGVPCVVCR